MSATSSLFQQVENPEKIEKSSANIDHRIDVTNGRIKRESVEKEDFLPYEKKYFALLHRCELVKQSNERLVNRIYYVKKLSRRRKKERKFLMDRLDGYGDDYRSAANALFSEMIGDNSPTRVPPESSKPDPPSTSFLVQVKTEPDT